MRMYYKTDDSGHICYTSDVAFDGAGEIELPDDFDFSRQHLYVVDDGAAVFDEAAAEAHEAEAKAAREKAERQAAFLDEAPERLDGVEASNGEIQERLCALAGTATEAQTAALAQMRAAVQIALQQSDVTDEQAMAVSTLYPEWEVGAVYSTGDIRRYGGALYRALQDSTGAAEHAPDIATSLWKRIGEPDPSGVFPWVQPLGATDAYKAGDRVTHAGKVWVSTVDNNVWEPGVYGWEAE